MPLMGFGTWPLGGNAYGPVPQKDAHRALEVAYASGIRLFDTANIYGNGKVEQLLGEVFEGVDDVQFMTKAGYRTEGGNEQDFSAPSLERALMNSLKRLRRDRVDVFLLHSPVDHILIDPVVRETTNTFLTNKMTSRIGVSLRHVHQYSLLSDWKEASVVELIFNLLDQRAIDLGILDHATEIKRRVVARLPLCSGFLTGKYRVGHTFEDNDSRASWGSKQLEKWITSASRFRYLESNSRTLTQAALSFCMETKGVFAIIPGMKNERQVQHNANAHQKHIRLNPQEYAEARRLWTELKDTPPH